MQRRSPRASAFGRPRPYESVQFIDEADDLAVRVGDLFEHRLQTIFKLTPELRTGNHRSEVDRHEPLVHQLFGDIALDDALRQAFDNGRLADARLADQDRIVLGPAAEHLHDAPDLFIASDYGIEPALASLFGEVEGVAFESLIFRFGVLVRDPLGSAHGYKGVENRVAVGAGFLEKPARRIVLLGGDGQQQVFGGDVLVLETL